MAAAGAAPPEILSSRLWQTRLPPADRSLMQNVSPVMLAAYAVEAAALYAAYEIFPQVSWDRAALLMSPLVVLLAASFAPQAVRPAYLLIPAALAVYAYQNVLGWQGMALAAAAVGLAFVPRLMRDQGVSAAV